MTRTTENTTQTPTDEDIRFSYLRHAARTQIYRWYSFCENPGLKLENQLDLLAPDFEALAGGDAIKGRDVYAQYMKNLPRPRTDAHDVRKTSVTVSAGRADKLFVDLLYISSEVDQDGSSRSLDLSYEIDLDHSSGMLPAFSKLVVNPIKEGRSETFTPTYANQRMLSLVHYWLTFVERPDRIVDPFEEILADEFKLYFAETPVTTLASLSEWLAGPASSIAASMHDIDQFQQRQLGDDTYEVTVDLDWLAITHGGGQAGAKTRHVWTVIDNPNERFPRLK